MVADWLSFVGDGRGKEHPLAFDNPPDDILTERFIKLLPSQVPENFRTEPLPSSEILSWVVLVLRIAESSLTDDKKGATKDRTAPGDGGRDSVTASEAATTPSSISYPSSNGSSSGGPFSVPIGLPGGTVMRNLQEIVKSRWLQVLSANITTREILHVINILHVIMFLSYVHLTLQYIHVS